MRKRIWVILNQINYDKDFELYDLEWFETRKEARAKRKQIPSYHRVCVVSLYQNTDHKEN